MKAASAGLASKAAALLAAGALLTAAFSFSWVFFSRHEILHVVEDALSREAGVLGERIDGVFRAASAVLAGMINERRVVTSYAISVPEASNFLLLDGEGRIRESAYDRVDRSPVGSALLDRLKSGSQWEIGEALVPSEGGKTLTMFRRLDAPNRAHTGAVAAVFTPRLIDDALASLPGTAIEAVLVGDHQERELLFRSRSLDGRPDFDSPEYVVGRYRLRSQPLRIVVVARRDALLGPRFRSRLTFSAFSAAAALFFALLSLYAKAAARGEEKARELSRELARREALYREVNHRVKNDLQVVRSVLSLGLSAGEAGGDEASAETLRTAESRINSISLVHELLYKKSALAAADLSEYIGELAANLSDAYGRGRPVEVVTQVQPGLALELENAVPCGLLLNELTTNAFKYAFPGGRAGRILLSASRAENGGVELRVEDDGVGFSGAPSERKASSFGLILAESLAGQLKAKLTRGGGPGEGTRWSFVLPPSSAEPRPTSA